MYNSCAGNAEIRIENGKPQMWVLMVGNRTSALAFALAHLVSANKHPTANARVLFIKTIHLKRQFK